MMNLYQFQDDLFERYIGLVSPQELSAADVVECIEQSEVNEEDHRIADYFGYTVLELLTSYVERQKSKSPDKWLIMSMYDKSN